VKVKIKSVPEIRLRSILVCKRFDYFAVSRTKQVFIFHPILHSVQSCRSIVGSILHDDDDRLKTVTWQRLTAWLSIRQGTVQRFLSEREQAQFDLIMVLLQGARGGQNNSQKNNRGRGDRVVQARGGVSKGGRGSQTTSPVSRGEF
jgi:hypothetical protein